MAAPCRIFRLRTFHSIKSCCSRHQSTLLQKRGVVKQIASLSSSSSIQNAALQEAEAERSSLAAIETPSVIDPLHHDDLFDVKELVKLRQLFECNVHLGHNSGLRSETMTPYIFGSRMGTDIIDLEQTVPLLQHALDLTANITYRGGIVLFLSRHLQTLPWVEKMAREVGEYSQCRPWRKGVFTNATNIFGTLPMYPDLCVFFHCQDTVFEPHKGIVESSKMLVPTIGICDTNIINSNIAYHVPGNDDTPKAVHLYIKLFREAVMRGKQKRKEDGLGLEFEPELQLKPSGLGLLK